jgi:prolyl-tRNA synthetase
VIHRLSTLFVRTLRDDPAEAEVPSHRLLVRAGYIRRAAPGGYTWLPLGMRVLQRVEQIVREEMNAIGAQEVHFPALLPREPYDATGRWTDYGPNLFRLQDRRGVDYLLGPTHEEMFTLLVKDLYGSYKDLPVWLYQIQTKYRDEARPRAGLLRGREFVMKDSYSFDLDDDGLQRSYDAHRAAYVKIFARLGLDVVIVKAMSGAMGGSASEEFLSPCASGEDTFVRCSACDYRANTEAVRIGTVPAIDASGTPAARVVDANRVMRAHPATQVHGRPPTPSRTCSSCSATPMAVELRSPSASRVTAKWIRSASKPPCHPPKWMPSAMPTSPHDPDW